MRVFLLSPWQLASHFRRALRVRGETVTIDRAAPLRGPIASGGGVYQHKDLNSEFINRLVSVFHNRGPSGNLDLAKLDRDWINTIFSGIGPIVRQYLGAMTHLDGMRWVVSDPQSASMSGSWHTDWVGHRLNCYVCIEGDGSQPTILIPTGNFRKGFVRWLRNAVRESPRWIGIEQKREVGKSIKCEHRTGSVFLFDTDLLHRGGYDLGHSRRVVLMLEFSDKRKKGLEAEGIGTTERNQFTFDESLRLHCPSFVELLDPERMSPEAGSKKFTYRVAHQ